MIESREATEDIHDKEQREVAEGRERTEDIHDIHDEEQREVIKGREETVKAMENDGKGDSERCQSLKVCTPSSPLLKKFLIQNYAFH